MAFRYCLAILLLIPSMGWSEENLYMGAGLGTSKYNGSGLDDSETYATVYGGYNVNSHVSMEVAYVDFGEVKDRVVPYGVISLKQDTLAINIKGFTIAPVLHYEPTESIQLSAMLGLAILDVDKKWTGGTVVDPVLANDNGGKETKAFGGVRLMYRPVNSLAIGLGYQHYEADDVDIDSTFGVIQTTF